MLKDLRVLDCADEGGSFCSRLLADLGASVIRIEKSADSGSEKTGPQDFFYAYHNANKLGITVDLEQANGRKTFRGLVQNADVLVETFRPGYLESMGLGFEELSRINPALIHIAITGFGQKTPGIENRSCDLVASASGGQMYVMGNPASAPCAPFGRQSYYATSLFGAVQVLLALRKRAQTGIGTYIDLSLQEAVASTLDHVMVRWFYEKTITKRQDNLYGNSFFCILHCKDGYIQLTLLQQWATLVELLAAEGFAQELTNEEWKDEAYRIDHISRIIEVIRAWTQSHTTDELFELGQAMRFPWAPICSLEDVMESPQLKARQFFTSVGGTDSHERILCPGLPYKFSSFSPTPVRPAPLPGEHNRALSEGSLWPLQTNEQKLHFFGSNSKPGNGSGGVLTGVRVLDFSWMLAGPYATRILADCGAEVIKVQSAKTADGAELNTTGYFNTWNRNKRSITLDLSRPEAREIVLKLVAISDIVVENFSPRVMENWGLIYDTLREANPDLIMTSISAMGQTGPWRDFVGYGPTFHALSGLTAMTSPHRQSPVGLGHAYADTIIGLYSALAILTALKQRDRTGQGQHIDISGYEAICTLMGPALLQASTKETAVSSYDNDDEPVDGAPCGCYQCAGDDRWCVIVVSNDNDWRTFCHLLDNPGWTTERSYSSPAERMTNRVVLDSHIETWTRKYAPETIVALMRNHGIAAGVVENAEDLAKNPCLVSRDFFIKLTHPVLGESISDRSAINFSKETIHGWKAAPLLGEGNRYVFKEMLGFSEEKYLSFVEQGIIG